MSGQLYRVEFRKSEPQFIFAETAIDARSEAAENVAAIIRPATVDELFEWMGVELEKAQVTLDEIERNFGIKRDCE